MRQIRHYLNEAQQEIRRLPHHQYDCRSTPRPKHQGLQHYPVTHWLRWNPNASLRSRVAQWVTQYSHAEAHVNSPHAPLLVTRTVSLWAEHSRAGAWTRHQNKSPSCPGSRQSPQAAYQCCRNQWYRVSYRGTQTRRLHSFATRLDVPPRFAVVRLEVAKWPRP